MALISMILFLSFCTLSRGWRIWYDAFTLMANCPNCQYLLLSQVDTEIIDKQLRMSKSQTLLSSKFYRLFERKPGMKVEPKAIVNLGDKEYVKFPFEAIYVNEEVVLYFIIEANTPVEFEYVKIEISIIHNLKKQVVHSVKEISKTLRKDSPHHMPFSFKVSEEGEYLIRTTTSYKQKGFITSPQSSSAQEKQQNAVMRLQISKIFGIKEKVLYLEKQKMITYPLLIQYTVENLTDKPRAFKADFVSEKFFADNLDPKPVYQMNAREIENVIIKLMPKDLQTLYQTNKLGNFRIFWQKDGKEQKPLIIKFDQIVKIKCSSVTKSIPKKDICTIRIKIEKKLNFEYPSIELCLKDVKQQPNPNIRILNMSKNKVVLDDRSSDEVDISVVGLASGCHLLKGLKLRNIDGQEIPYENEMVIMIMNESEEKQEKKIFEATGAFDVFDMSEL